MNRTMALRLQLERQIAHWRAAMVTIDDIDNFASQEAWGRVEKYLNVAIRGKLGHAIRQMQSEINGLAAQLSTATDIEQLRLVRARLLAFRHRYVAVETTLDFFGDAINTRSSPKLGSILRALDLVASRSIEAVLCPLGREAPPVLTYIDKGLGASILRAGVRLWDGSLSPSAAIKITRHNLYRPTSLIHETGHQVAHILGWTDEFMEALRYELSGRVPGEVVEGWVNTASEIVADIHAFVHCGYGAVAALHDVIAADENAVLRYIPGDPHPIPYIRVLLNVEYCKRMYGAGPWDHLAAAWKELHPLEHAVSDTRQFLRQSIDILPKVADISLVRRMRCFGGRAISDLVDPLQVRPETLQQWSNSLGMSLETSLHWADAAPVRLLALFSYKMAMEPQHSARIANQYEAWTQRIGTTVRAA